MISRLLSAVALAGLLSSGCGDNVRNDVPDSGSDEVPSSYTFDSKFVSGESSVSYSGQTFRQLLIESLKAELGAWTDEIDANGKVQTPTEWLEELNFYVRFDEATSLEQPIDLGLEMPAVQTTWSQVSGGASLIEKLAGEDDVTDHKDWDADGEPVGVAGGFVGWSEGGVATPLELVDHWMQMASQQAADRAANVPVDPFGDDIEHVYITPAGQDLRQLIQKFLLGALTFSQGTDDYLDSGTAGKGLESSNLQDEDNAYSVLEHTWDEGFGYFGSVRDFANRDGSSVTLDTSGDGMIDFKSEWNAGMALNAVKRDAASQPAATTFADEIFTAFIAGRHIIWSSAGAELDEAAKSSLEVERDRIVDGWGDVFAATIIHYINEVNAEMAKIGDTAADYSFTEHAKVWSELKGFALALQFNPRSKLSAADFAELHELIGNAPVVTDVTSDLEAYGTKLITARDLVRDAHDFDSGNAANW